jgi:hypothetical protein
MSTPGNPTDSPDSCRRRQPSPFALIRQTLNPKIFGSLISLLGLIMMMDASKELFKSKKYDQIMSF